MTKSLHAKRSNVIFGLLIGVVLAVPVFGGASASRAAVVSSRSQVVRSAPGAFQRKVATSVVRQPKVADRKVRANRSTSVPMRLRSSVSRPVPSKLSVRGPRRVSGSAPVLPDVEWDAMVSASFDFGVDEGLQFSNWAGKGVDASVDMLIEMFGSESVCSLTTAVGCELRQGAEDLLSAFNEQIVFGRCEGMVALVGMAIESGRDVASLDIDAAEYEIVRWSLSQVAPRVVDRMEETRRMQPSTLVAELSNRIRSGRTATLAMWGEGFAHSVLPVAVNQLDSTTEIIVWDPNQVDELATVRVDRESETWTYAAAIDPTGASTVLSGSGSGYLGFVENDLRIGQHSARFID